MYAVNLYFFFPHFTCKVTSKVLSGFSQETEKFYLKSENLKNSIFGEIKDCSTVKVSR